MTFNLRKKKNLSIGSDIPWNILFCTSIWQIWKDRNCKSFDNSEVPPVVSSKVIWSYAYEIVEAFKTIFNTDSPMTRLNPWFPPLAGNLKLNTDGSWYESTRRARFGGIFRNAQGKWKLGYPGKMVASSSLETEIWNIYRGLTIILEEGFSNVQVESDSQVAVLLFNDGAPVNHPQSNLINARKYLVNRMGSTLTHINCNVNQCAEFLARMGAEQNEAFVVTTSPPLPIREFLIRDNLNLHQFLD